MKHNNQLFQHNNQQQHPRNIVDLATSWALAPMQQPTTAGGIYVTLSAAASIQLQQRRGIYERAMAAATTAAADSK